MIFKFTKKAKPEMASLFFIKEDGFIYFPIQIAGE